MICLHNCYFSLYHAFLNLIFEDSFKTIQLFPRHYCPQGSRQFVLHLFLFITPFGSISVVGHNVTFKLQKRSFNIIASSKESSEVHIRGFHLNAGTHLNSDALYGFCIQLNFFVCVTCPLAPVHERWNLMLHALGQTPWLWSHIDYQYFLRLCLALSVCSVMLVCPSHSHLTYHPIHYSLKLLYFSLIQPCTEVLFLDIFHNYSQTLTPVLLDMVQNLQGQWNVLKNILTANILIFWAILGKINVAIINLWRKSFVSILDGGSCDRGCDCSAKALQISIWIKTIHNGNESHTCSNYGEWACGL